MIWDWYEVWPGKCGEMVKTKSQKVLRADAYFWRSYRGKTGRICFWVSMILMTILIIRERYVVLWDWITPSWIGCFLNVLGGKKQISCLKTTNIWVSCISKTIQFCCSNLLCTSSVYSWNKASCTISLPCNKLWELLIKDISSC